MHNEKVGRPTLSSDGSPSRVVNFRLTHMQYDQLQTLYKARDPREYAYWPGEDISFSEMVRQILIHEPISIRVASLEGETHRYYTELREVERLLKRRKAEPELKEFMEALQPALDKISELSQKVKSLSVQPISFLKG